MTVTDELLNMQTSSSLHFSLAACTIMLNVSHLSTQNRMLDTSLHKSSKMFLGLSDWSDPAGLGHKASSRTGGSVTQAKLNVTKTGKLYWDFVSR